MKVVVIAATGRVGRRVVELARAAGHEVTAVARAPVGLPDDVPAIAADLAEDTVAPALADAVRDADAVLSCLGARSSGDVGVASRGTIAIVRAMEAVGVRRLLVISAAPVSTVPTPSRPHPPRHDPGDGVLVRYVVGPLVKRILRRTYDDLARMEEAVCASSLEWTILRPPRLTDRPTRPGTGWPTATTSGAAHRSPAPPLRMRCWPW
jgi:nucleoside-diphosphate-sugar epimerase